ncbi:MAG: hypothetical protein KatS3mg131_0510 [Candidatus Tectimicrobiota bacterium]|nr:MAG: hypothetical protein KatS3mg131_0510 [Candidatus Tectomicrobia bacterium]
MTRTDTAFEAWDARWQTEAGRAAWLEPEAEVQAVVPLLRARGVRTVLDLGCGVGRHARFLAQQGFVVYACDASWHGLAYLRQDGNLRGSRLLLCQAQMTALPYRAACLDYVLAWNVIYHGDETVVRQVLAEIARVLKPGALLQATMLSKRNVDVRTGREIAPNTFVNEGTEDKHHPHYYCNAAELVALLRDFELLRLSDVEQRRPGAYHWQFVAERRP